MPRSRMFLYERAYRNCKGIVRRFFSAYLAVCRQSWDWFRTGRGERIIRCLLLVAGVVLIIGAGVQAALAHYSHSHSAGDAIGAFVGMSVTLAVFALLYSLIVYIATTYLAALAGVVTVLVMGTLLGLLAMAVLTLYVVVLIAVTGLSWLLFVPLRLCHWLWLQKRKITYKCPYDD